MKQRTLPISQPAPAGQSWKRGSVLPVGLSLLLFLVGAVRSPAGGGPTRNFDIAAGDATKTLRVFATQADRQIMFLAELVVGVRTNAVRGVFTPRAALDWMLADTDLRVVEDAKTGALMITRSPRPTPGSIRITRPPPDHA